MEHTGVLIAAVHRGRAGAALLNTYEAERRPVALATVSESHRRLVEAMRAHRDGTPPAARPSEGLVLGYRYESAAVCDDDTPPPDGDPVAGYRPTARPGHRLPHLWLADAGGVVSTLDLVGPGLTLLAGPDADWVPDRTSAALITRRIGVDGLRDPDDVLCGGVGIDTDGAVLVRPDGRVAWHTCGAPTDGLDLVLTALLARPVDAGHILGTSVEGRLT